MKILNYLLSISILSVFLFFACKKEDSSTVLKVKLTDAPASFEEVNVDVKAVNVKLDGDTSNWISLTTIPGVYNLLALQDGIDTLI
ncbi:MAG: DUF4382 domain-containing protein, partial [Chitinophagaceae bacterium]|nr:DUF4382 domain-containing protein [Chitinophagaceae bacterium]